jgi:putative phosphoribosyl transferase
MDQRRWAENCRDPPKCVNIAGPRTYSRQSMRKIYKKILYLSIFSIRDCVGATRNKHLNPPSGDTDDPAYPTIAGGYRITAMFLSAPARPDAFRPTQLPCRSAPFTPETGLAGDLVIPPNASELVVFAEDTGPASSNPRLRLIARSLLQRGLGVLLANLGHQDHENDELLNQAPADATASRLDSLIRQTASCRRTRHLRLGIFASRGGTPAALLAAARQPSLVDALVSHCGTPELAADVLPKVTTPTLLIVGGNDKTGVEAHRKVQGNMNRKSLLQIVGGAGPHFHEPGKLDQVASMAFLWFRRHLTPA